ncbi:MAG: M23 family metallopeptidase, partial [Anaerolineales bacterium]|nr:M23 family metallopeptidase [Anaerolineales bacterium]
GGMTGLAWTPHLHFEVQRFIGGQWVPVDPYGWNGSLSSDPWPYRDYNYPLWRHLIYLPLVTKQPTDTYEPNNSFSTAYSIALSSWYESYIWTTSDQDWYQFSVSVPPNQARYIRALLQSIPPGTDYDIEIYSPSNALLGRANRSGNQDESLQVYVTQSGLYRVKVYSFSGSSQSDSYRLRVDVLIAPQSNPPSGYP